MLTILVEKILKLLTGWLNAFTEHATNVLEKLNLIEEDTSNLPDIKTNTDSIVDNTGAVISPINNISSNTSSIKTDTTSIKNSVTAIQNNVNTISTNTGTASAFAEDIANNTLDMKDRLVTIGSDTTQIRSNSNNLTADVSDIKTYLGYYVANTPVTEDADGGICNIDTDLEDYLQKAVCTIPSDISGFSSINIIKKGSNLLPFDAVIGEGWSRSADGITAEYSNGIMHVYGTNELNAWNNIVAFNDAWRNNEIIFPSGTFSIPNHLVVRISEDNVNYGNKGGTVTYNNPIYVRGFYISVNANATVDWYVPMTFVCGSVIPTTYEPYKIVTDTVSLGSTITDGAEIDLLSGVVKINTTPATYSSITPIAIRTYKGINNIYSDNGNMSVTYRETLKHYLDKQQ